MCRANDFCCLLCKAICPPAGQALSKQLSLHLKEPLFTYHKLLTEMHMKRDLFLEMFVLLWLQLLSEAL